MSADVNVDLCIGCPWQAHEVEYLTVYLKVFDSIEYNLFVRRGQLVEGTRVCSDALTIRCSFVTAALKHFTDLVIVWKVLDAVLRSPREYI